MSASRSCTATFVTRLAAGGLNAPAGGRFVDLNGDGLTDVLLYNRTSGRGSAR